MPQSHVLGHLAKRTASKRRRRPRLRARSPRRQHAQRPHAGRCDAAQEGVVREHARGVERNSLRSRILGGIGKNCQCEPSLSSNVKVRRVERTASLAQHLLVIHVGPTPACHPM